MIFFRNARSGPLRRISAPARAAWLCLALLLALPGPIAQERATAATSASPAASPDRSAATAADTAADTSAEQAAASAPGQTPPATPVTSGSAASAAAPATPAAAALSGASPDGAADQGPNPGQSVQPSAPGAPGAPGDVTDEPAPPAPFGFADVTRAARELAGRSYQNPDSQVPDFLLGLSADQWNRIRFDSGRRLRAGPFSVEFFHPGFIYNRVVRLNVVDEGRSGPVPFSPDLFDYGDDALAARAGAAALNFAGFRLFFPLYGEDSADEVASFLGASYYRAVGRHASYGVSARGLALDTALPDGEEFPYFREFWLEKPAPDARSMKIYALMDSPSLTGAFALTLTPGSSALMDVESVFFRRRGRPWPAKIGLAPVSSMFLHSETGNGAPGDYRPEVHNSDGLIYRTDDDIWHWRPLANPARLEISSVPLDNPRGFGLVQRDASFDHYQDIGARFERRGSLWVEPTQAWGPGRLELIEIPSREDFHDNITAFWVPDPSLLMREGPEGEADRKDGGEPRDFISFAYRLYWMTPGATPHGLGRAAATRVFRSPRQSNRLVFIIDFEGEALKALPADTGLSSVVESPLEFPVLDKQLLKNPVTGGWRLQFSLLLPQAEGVAGLFAARDSRPRVRAMLKRGENIPDALTETWAFDVPY